MTRLPGFAPLSLVVCAAVTFACTDDPPPAGHVLTSTRDEPPGANCTEGGTAVLAGNDRDGDERLDATEVESTVYVCRRDRVRLVVELPGANCADGGTAVWVGDDRDGDDVLDPDEVRDIAYVCTDAHELVSRLDAPAADAPCAEGGALRVGLDRDDDGVLDNDEIMITEFVCGAALQGNIVINSAADVARYAGVRAAVGELNITDATNPEIALPDLWFVGGDVAVRDNDNLTALRLPQLFQVGGTFSLHRDPALASVEIPHLRVVGGSVSVGAVGELTGLDLDFASVEDAVVVSENPKLASIDWIDTYIGGRIQIENNPRLATLRIEARSAVDQVWIRNNATLTSAVLDPYEVKRDLWVDGNPALTSLTLAVGTVGTDLWITNNAVLNALHADILVGGGLQEIGGDLRITGSPIEQFDVCCGEGIHVDGDATLSNLRVPRLRDDSNHIEWVLGDLRVSDNPGLTSLRVKVAGGIEVSRNPVLTHASFVYDSADVSASFVTVQSNPALTWFATSYLDHVDSAIDIHDNPLLPFLGLDEVSSAGNVSVTGNAALPACQVTRWFDRLLAWSETQSGNDTSATCN